MKKITDEQIEQLFDFTRKHYVEHYYVQVELVDRLVNDIELQWKENPNIPFEDALETVLKSSEFLVSRDWLSKNKMSYTDITIKCCGMKC